MKGLISEKALKQIKKVEFLKLMFEESLSKLLRDDEMEILAKEKEKNTGRWSYVQRTMYAAEVKRVSMIYRKALIGLEKMI